MSMQSIHTPDPVITSTPVKAEDSINSMPEKKISTSPAVLTLVRDIFVVVVEKVLIDSINDYFFFVLTFIYLYIIVQTSQ